MNNHQFEMECLRFRGFHHIFYPRDMKRKASLAEIFHFADWAGGVAAEDHYVLLEDLDYEWIEFKRKYRGALVHLLKHEGVEATRKFITLWKKSFKKECEKKK